MKSSNTINLAKETYNNLEPGVRIPAESRDVQAQDL